MAAAQFEVAQQLLGQGGSVYATGQSCPAVRDVIDDPVARLAVPVLVTAAVTTC